MILCRTEALGVVTVLKVNVALSSVRVDRYPFTD